MTPEEIRAKLTTSLLGRRVEVHSQLGSTNDLVREAARRGEPEGLVILAEEQLAGRGRLGRVWSAPPGCCILCSVLLRPRFSPEDAFYLTIAAALAIYRACKRVLPAEDVTTAPGTLSPQVSNHPPPISNHPPQISSHSSPLPNHLSQISNQPPQVFNQPHQVSNQPPRISIKWPNDVLINGSKVCGVLSESEFRGGEWAFAVIGFGINVNLQPEQLAGLGGSATSLSIALGHEVDRIALLADVLSELESLYFALQNGQSSWVFQSWASALETVGRQVSVSEAGGSIIQGKATRVDPDGALVLDLGRGQERRVLAGDVTLSPTTKAD
ncbi:MAG: biotin--[acetyl-CoA-carboxylase] ligase [Chloroflexota bacterium]|nr:biotin--[acetyl-CoA-carboxylase] ligase [Chloroflexota bacterium]